MKTIAVDRKLVIATMAAVLIGIVSCTKETYELPAETKETSLMTGHERPANNFLRVVELGTGAPVTGAEVRLEMYGEASQVLAPNYLITDAMGSITWPVNWKVNSVCVQESETHYGTCETSATGLQSSEAVMTLAPKAWFRLQAVDLEALNPDHFVRIELPVYNDKVEYIELDAWEIAMVPVYGNQHTEVYYTVRSVLDPDEVVESLQVSANGVGGEILDLKVPY